MTRAVNLPKSSSESDQAALAEGRRWVVFCDEPGYFPTWVRVDEKEGDIAEHHTCRERPPNTFWVTREKAFRWTMMLVSKYRDSDIKFEDIDKIDFEEMADLADQRQEEFDSQEPPKLH